MKSKRGAKQQKDEIFAGINDFQQTAFILKQNNTYSSETFMKKIGNYT